MSAQRIHTTSGAPKGAPSPCPATPTMLPLTDGRVWLVEADVIVPRNGHARRMGNAWVCEPDEYGQLIT